MEWTEETIFRLRSLWQEGHSTAEIGRRMSITKNAVVGKAHRLTLPARPSPIRKMPVGPDGRPSQAARPVRSLPSGEASRVAQFVPRSTISEIEDAEASQAGIDAFAGGSVTPLRASPAMAVKPQTAAPPARADEVSSDPQPEVLHVRREPHVASVPRAADQPPRRYGQSCCWPLGDPGTKQFHFCGGEPIPGKPYCVEHAQLAYVKLRDRRETVA